MSRNGLLTWKDGKIGSNYGCLEPYSGESIEEDVAVFIGCLGYEETPESLKKIIDRVGEKKDEISKDEGLKMLFYGEFGARTDRHLEVGKFDVYFNDGKYSVKDKNGSISFETKTNNAIEEVSNYLLNN